MNVRMYAGPGGNRGVFSAWDPVQAKTVWSVNENFPVWSGALATAGDVFMEATLIPCKVALKFLRHPLSHTHIITNGIGQKAC